MPLIWVAWAVWAAWVAWVVTVAKVAVGRAVTPVTTPGTPTSLSGTADDASVVLNWTAPTVTGGTAITDYTVESSSDSGTTWTAFSHDAATTASLRVTGLTNGTAYTFRVSAVNAVGTGTASATASATLSKIGTVSAKVCPPLPGVTPATSCEP